MKAIQEQVMTLNARLDDLQSTSRSKTPPRRNHDEEEEQYLDGRHSERRIRDESRVNNYLGNI